MRLRCSGSHRGFLQHRTDGWRCFQQEAVWATRSRTTRPDQSWETGRRVATGVLSLDYLMLHQILGGCLDDGVLSASWVLAQTWGSQRDSSFRPLHRSRWQRQAKTSAGSLVAEGLGYVKL